MMMDRYTKNALWAYWKRGNDEETPLYKAFKEFNYLLKIDVDVLTKDIPRFKTYDEYKNGWIYEWNKDVPWVANRPWLDYGPWIEPSDDSEHVFKSFLFQNRHAKWPTYYEWYDGLEYDELKDEALNNKAIMEELMKVGEESRKTNDTDADRADQGWFGKHAPMKDDDDDNGDLEGYLI
nr:hypothetical protein [Tanacetum cinerariifolium]